MFLARAKVVKNAKTAVRASHEAQTKHKKPKLEDFLTARDYTGAVTLLEFQRLSEPSEKILPWLAYAAFHLGDYPKALKVYQELLERPDADPVYHLYTACCYFYMGLHEEASKAVQQGPKTRLYSRIKYHLAHQVGDEAGVLELHHELTDSTEDQLSIAALHFMRNHFQDASDIYKRLLVEFRDEDYLALQVYMALCYYKLDYYDVSLDILGSYLEAFPDSAVALNLKACNQFKLFDGKSAENELKAIIEILHNSSQNVDNDLVKHNLVVFREGENALQVLPPLVDVIPEARLNLVVSYLRNGEVTEAYEMMKDLEPNAPQEFVLKGVVLASYGVLPEVPEHVAHDLLETAKSLFRTVGSSASECDTIPGRQSMSSCFWLMSQFDDVLVYLNSVKVYCFNDPIFNYNYGIALACTGQFREAEDSLMLVTHERLASEFMFISWLARCFIMNGKSRDAWELYLKMDSGGETFNLLRIIANDCYKVGSFYYAAKAFDVLERVDPNNPEYWDGKLGASCGVLQLCCAGLASKQELRDIIDILSASQGNPQVQHVVRIMNGWLRG